MQLIIGNIIIILITTIIIIIAAIIIIIIIIIIAIIIKRDMRIFVKALRMLFFGELTKSGILLYLILLKCP